MLQRLLLALAAASLVYGYLDGDTEYLPSEESIFVEVIYPTYGMANFGNEHTYTVVADVIPSTKYRILFVVDTSGSTLYPQGFDCNKDGVFSVADDYNKDNAAGTPLDCFIAALHDVVALNIPNFEVGIISFTEEATQYYLTTDGKPWGKIFSKSVYEADQPDILEIADGFQSEGGTNFQSALVVADAYYFNSSYTSPGYDLILWVTDTDETAAGVNTTAGGALRSLASKGVVIQTFGIGVGITCDTLHSLYEMANITGGECHNTTDPTDLGALLTAQVPILVNITAIESDTSEHDVFAYYDKTTQQVTYSYTPSVCTSYINVTACISDPTGNVCATDYTAITANEVYFEDFIPAIPLDEDELEFPGVMGVAVWIYNPLLGELDLNFTDWDNFPFTVYSGYGYPYWFVVDGPSEGKRSANTPALRQAERKALELVTKKGGLRSNNARYSDSDGYLLVWVALEPGIYLQEFVTCNGTVIDDYVPTYCEYTDPGDWCFLSPGGWVLLNGGSADWFDGATIPPGAYSYIHNDVEGYFGCDCRFHPYIYGPTDFSSSR